MGKLSKNPSKANNKIKKALRDAREDYLEVDIPMEKLEFWEPKELFDPEKMHYDGISKNGMIDSDKIYFD